MKLQVSILTNKYAEGYPSKRYYGGVYDLYKYYRSKPSLIGLEQ